MSNYLIHFRRVFFLLHNRVECVRNVIFIYIIIIFIFITSYNTLTKLLTRLRCLKNFVDDVSNNLPNFICFLITYLVVISTL